MWFEMERTILLVSDSPTQRMALQSLLSGYGYNIITAGDGVSALNRVYREMPSLIVSDVVLPNLGGYHLCRLLKNDPQTAHVHVILLTSLDQKRNRFWGLEAGADIYLENQGSPEPILEAVGQLLRDAQPASNGKQALAMHAASFSDFSATTHLNTLLDQLLFELTVRTAVRDVAQDIRERGELYAGLFGLLERVFDYDVASLVVQNPEGMQIIFDTPTALNAHDLYALVDTIQDEQTPGTAGQQSLYVDLIRPDMVYDAASAQFINSHISVAFEIDQDIRAQLGLYSTQENAYGQESNSILKVVSDELATVLHSIAKTDEIEQLKADFTAMLVHDLRSPLTAVIGYAELIVCK